MQVPSTCSRAALFPSATGITFKTYSSAPRCSYSSHTRAQTFSSFCEFDRSLTHVIGKKEKIRRTIRRSVVYHVSLARPSACPGSTAKMRITSVHVQTPTGGEWGESATYTRCTRPALMARIAAIKGALGDTVTARALHTPRRRDAPRRLLHITCG